MKIFKRLLTAALAVFIFTGAYAQDASSLVAEGNQFYNSANYTAAIEKYTAALKLEPGNIAACYRLGFSLSAAGRGKEALPYLQKAISSGAGDAVISSSYALMAAIYDQSAQPEKAIESYLHAITLDSGNASLHYSLGLAYFRSKRYAEAEKSAVNAISSDPAMADAYRLYGLVTFHQDERAPALLGLCSYLWLSPRSAKSPEAYGNIGHILAGGALKPEPGIKREPLSAGTLALNQAITKAVASARSKTYSTQADKFAAQLDAIFTAIGPMAEKENTDPLFSGKLAKVYYKLAQSPHLKAFACFISQSADKTSASWLSAHPTEFSGLRIWMNQVNTQE